ncbi:DNA-3-methyladenine glycosylase I [Chenggangzhangella methanolivorans]|uniref:DNA-3-methyladenine glycosylase I n=1 Tax=Chenggangzhangella methanolivorans TaxID=1437009 RepID=A0A9E6RCV5_9HYPH|nr:DNA-3-methyladenine glycosylase I [Chenggangzhangella methanolivorans]QZO00913.1 DNA-3-methyladenine glycosylase I [Chenggangzhangella methanolivorans]
MSQASAKPSVLVHPDGKTRCAWCGTDPLYVHYHDTDWGRPERDARALYEKLVLDGFQAGLAWITILRKREAFRAAFEGFRPEIVAAYGEADVARLMANPGIVRSRSKIEGAVKSARAYLAMAEKGEDFSDYLWGFVDGAPKVNAPRAFAEVPTSTPLSEKLSKDLKKRGFVFCGPVIVYAFMEAVGMVDDHMHECWRAGGR